LATAVAAALYVTDKGGRAAYRLQAKPAHTGLQPWWSVTQPQ